MSSEVEIIQFIRYPRKVLQMSNLHESRLMVKVVGIVATQVEKLSHHAISLRARVVALEIVVAGLLVLELIRVFN